ncbi:MAG TPA: undecaprenyldiphospho-muramoylpentapeptide beta-N-acetylglucosaminyltransferase [Xanthomonadales bacterium]|nr:undecaprenyldiphospho-muramoylpentapeptide beta-N-acetylglucosaminyltransferase [Xanthomonadales bacterium]
MSAPVLVMAGGTGGHVFPGLAVAAALRQRNIPVVWLGSEGGMEQTLVPRHDIPFEAISVSGMRGKGWKKKLRLPLDLGRAFWQARKVLKRVRPMSVLSLGGYAAGPGGLAAFWLRRPLLVHEQNSIPGLTNRVLAKLAQRVLTGFPGVFAGRGRWVGNPVRAEIAALPAPAERLANRSGPMRVLVIGGSQGAAALNRLLPQTLALMPAGERPEIWHQCGARLIDDAKLGYRKAGIDGRVVAFIDDMAAAYGWADLVICRAGALTLAELTAAGVAALLVPYPHAVDDHQTANARWLCSVGAAELLPESTLNAQILCERLQALAADRGQLLRMAQAAREQARTDAADAVALACLEIGR